ncbi:MAG: excinuclease ABC subunit UvrA [Puniceicoccales bacterium]|nr:excinuclease ABC subunit UvrA [Puniceicoccales bacterium]
MRSSLSPQTTEAPAADTSFIRIRGAQQNNLQNLDLDIPVGKLIVITGLSGAGKSSLVFDTLHAEGQRRYVETFSPYTRQFLDLMPAPKVGLIEGIRPSIAIQQGNTVKTSRSTVGTMTELCDWFKVWFAHRAQLHDPATGDIIRAHHPESVWDSLSRQHPGATVLAGFAVERPAQLKWSLVLAPFIAQGYVRGVFAGRVMHLDKAGTGEFAKQEKCLVVQDRIAVLPENRERFIEAATVAFRLGRGRMNVLLEDTQGQLRADADSTLSFAGELTSQAGKRFRPAIPAMFSFNSPIGACPDCHGFGRVIGVDWEKVFPDPDKTLGEGAIAPFQGQVYGESQQDLQRCMKKLGVPMDVPWGKLTQTQRSIVIEGEPGYDTESKGRPRTWYGVREFFKWLESTAYKMHVRVFLSRYRSYTTCQHCGGRRLQEESLCWKWSPGTQASALDLPQLYALPVSALLATLRPHRAPQSRHPADQALEAILSRLAYLEDVGLGYLTPDRQSRTLSGGEVQRVNLTACLGAALADALFVLDEPSIGLHPQDLGRMTNILRQLVVQGNTVVVVEHDESVMRKADFLVEIGPRPGRGGGQLVYAGDMRGMAQAAHSATGPWLSGSRKPPASMQRKVDAQTPRLRLHKVSVNNLRNLSLDVPLGRFVGLCGVSGSGKSSLLNEVLAQCATPSAGTGTGESKTIFSASFDSRPDEVALVDQSPVSRTPRSNPALYAGAWGAIRKRLAATPEAKEAGLTHSHFSFNSGDGRCPHCGGSGWETVEMQFLANVHIPCPACEGKRFRPEILAFLHRGKSVADILELTIEEALPFFADDASVTRPLSLLADVGLSYLTLGQPLNTLSGGEAQRLKLVRFLGAFDTNKHALILLDEPTTGLHREDVARLIAILQHLVDAGHSLVVIEHQTDMLNAADWLLELGPGAGDAGGRLVYQGTPGELASHPTSPTGKFICPQ